MEVSSEVQTKLDQVFKLPKAVRIGAACGIALMLGVGYFFGFHQSAMEEVSRLRSQELLRRALAPESRSQLPRSTSSRVWQDVSAPGEPLDGPHALPTDLLARRTRFDL